MKEVEVDGLLVGHLPNLRYLFGFSGSQALALIIDREALLLVDSRYIDQAQKEVTNCQPVLSTPSLVHQLRELFTKHCRRRRVAVEAERIPYELVLRMESWGTDTNLVPTYGLIEELRSIKDDSEIDILREGFQLARSSLQTFLAEFRPGISENEAAAKLEYECRKAGSSGSAFDTIIASGSRSALPHGIASQKRIQADEPVVIDFGIRHQGYCTDMTRVLHRDLPEVIKIYSIVEEAQKAALDQIRPGVSSTEIDGAEREVITRHGYGTCFGHSTGHGLGLEVLYKPDNSSRLPCTIEAGMVFTVEPGIYLPGQFGVRIEDVVVVTPNGYTLLSQ